MYDGGRISINRGHNVDSSTMTQPPVRSEVASATAAVSIGSTDSSNTKAAGRGSTEKKVEASGCEVKPISESKSGLEAPF